MIPAYLALELGLDGGPGLGLSGVGEKVHDNGRLGNGLVDVEQVLAGNPAIRLSFLPRSTVLPYTDDDVEAIVAHVETLAVTLGAVANHGHGVVLEVLKKLLLWPVITLCSAYVSSRSNATICPQLTSNGAQNLP